jgi:hypothetical protein
MTRFLPNDTLWEAIRKKIETARTVAVAVAYLGHGAAELLPLKEGHQLIVNMSLKAVREGATDPKEVRKFIRRKVQVFSRGRLHAKFALTDRVLIVSSANASNNSRSHLDEAGLITDDTAARLRAKAFFEKLCGEPVREEYLKKCLKEYRPPKFPIGLPTRQSGTERVIEARVWFVGGLSVLEPKGEDAKSLKTLEFEASCHLRKTKGSEVNWIRYRTKPKFFDRVRDDDWIVRSMVEEGGAKFVHPPAQVISRKPWKSAKGTTYQLLVLEDPTNGESMPWKKFCTKIWSVEPSLASGRTRPLLNEETADDVLRLWTATGKIAASISRSFKK